MRPLGSMAATVLALCYLGLVSAGVIRRTDIIKPKIMIISMFAPEATIWQRNLPRTPLGDLHALNLTLPGLSMLHPTIHCTATGAICQLTTGEGEINAASSTAALALSPRFDLRQTYFLVAGIAGVNPRRATLGGVALARYAVQVALQHELDAREMPDGFETGYVPFGAAEPYADPGIWYGTEVMELNGGLRDRAFEFARRGELVDSEDAVAYRGRYGTRMGEEVHDHPFAAGVGGPEVVKCDAATSDVYYSGKLLSESFERITEVWTDGTGVYCMTAQEDNATLEVLVRMAVYGLVDFGRVIVMRTGRVQLRPPASRRHPYDHLLGLHQNGFDIAIENIFRAGVEIVKGILQDWDGVFDKGIPAPNYIGDVFGSLGGEPDFGPGSMTDGNAVSEGGLAHSPKVWS
ncbi:purine nucleoside permease [Chaetomium sp. MPI-CAGE-AT-0009]|nr:purine nucleoside permease [Chaetomium sp. MPI-CAGE-AT-0009]